MKSKNAIVARVAAAGPTSPPVRGRSGDAGSCPPAEAVPAGVASGDTLMAALAALVACVAAGDGVAVAGRVGATVGVVVGVADGAAV
jgi:hypothetical protein